MRGTIDKLAEDERHARAVRDRLMLRAVLKARWLGDREREAFGEMLEDVERTGRPLTERRRWWLADACHRHRIATPSAASSSPAMGPRVLRPPPR